MNKICDLENEKVIALNCYINTCNNAVDLANLYLKIYICSIYAMLTNVNAIWILVKKVVSL